MRTPLSNEADRPGGAGVYHHFDYVGIPRNYKWINTIQLIKTWEQMQLTYEKGERSLWTANLKSWATREFGPSVADDTAEIINTYGKLIVRCKYKLLSRSPFVYSTAFYNEAEHTEHHDAFFEMVLHPVLVGKTVVELYIKATLSAWYHKQRRTSADKLADDVFRLFDEDSLITDRFHALSGDKWDLIMQQVHIGYDNWNDPPENRMPNVSYHTQANVPKSGIIGVSVQGSSQSAPGDPETTLLAMNPYMPPSERRYLDIFTRNNGTFSFRATSNVSYVNASAPPGLSWAGIKIQPIDAPGSWNITAKLPVNKTSVPISISGYVESGGVVSIEAEHFASSETKGGLSYIKLPHYGRTLSGMKLWPVTALSQDPSTAPKLTYSFHSFTSSENARVILFLGGSTNHDPSRPLKLAFSIDGGTPTTVRPVPDTPMGQNPSGWTEATVAGGWTSFITVSIAAGSHELSLWLLEPGVVVQTC
ncbi:unnamed protein product [Clonostachys chloroleuca]|uniref:Gylcosyl hydrolase 115 C-terminal domain-containing protein n=1 Tax=Clonostachys chloroleuca TaxID=1926264 RepID=A0AA35MC58_9HYPO|nr:unnamed protein product [Clonostachys chloroleuca]